MRGTIHNQVESLFHNAAKGITVSRHQMKIARQEDTLIHSDNTRQTYLGVWHRIVQHAYDKFGVCQVCNVTPDMATDWLRSLLPRRLAPQTLRTYLAATTKLFAAIDTYQTQANNKPNRDGG